MSMPMRTVFVVMLSLAAFTAAGQPAAKPSPPLAINRPGSPAIQLTQYRGKIVLVAFIHTTGFQDLIGHLPTQRLEQFRCSAFPLARSR